MEPRFDFESKYAPPLLSIEEYFSAAMNFAESVYSAPLSHYRSIRYPDHATPDNFWNEYIWVVYTSGFNSKVVAKIYPRLLSAYGHWTSTSKLCWSDVCHVNGNRAKFSAVVSVADLLQSYTGNDNWWSHFRRRYLDTPDRMQQLPFIGKITKYHLARNLGHDSVKPDLHLVRLAEHFDFPDPQCMCEFLSGLSGERVGVVDLVLFYAASEFGTTDLRTLR